MLEHSQQQFVFSLLPLVSVINLRDLRFSQGRRFANALLASLLQPPDDSPPFPVLVVHLTHRAIASAGFPYILIGETKMSLCTTRDDGETLSFPRLRSSLRDGSSWRVLAVNQAEHEIPRHTLLSPNFGLA